MMAEQGRSEAGELRNEWIWENAKPFLNFSVRLDPQLEQELSY
jgi:hypothetical protein